MQLVLPRGFSSNFVLLIWGLCGGLFIYAFLANFRTILLMPQYEAPVDSAQDILDRGMIPFVINGGEVFRDHLLQSSNPVYQQLGKIIIIPKDYDTFTQMVREDIQGANTHVYLGTLYEEEREDGKFHASKDVL